MEDERGVMLISTSIRINDNMSSDEKKRAIQSIVKLVDIAILNNEDSCKFGVTFERRLDASRLFRKTPYDEYEVQNIELFDAVLEKQFSEISDSIKIQSVFSEERSVLGDVINDRCRYIHKGEKRALILFAAPNSTYRRKRLLQYSDRKFMSKTLSEHSAILEKIYATLDGNSSTYSTHIQVSCSYIGPFSDCSEGCVMFWKLGMSNLKDSFQTYQMTLAFIEFLGKKGIACSKPKAKFASLIALDEIVFEFTCKKGLESKMRRKDW